MSENEVQPASVSKRNPPAKGATKGLGRGLGSLLGGAPAERSDRAEPVTQAKAPETLAPETLAPGSRVWELELDRIVPNPKQPRKEFSQEELASLAASIRAQGVLQPVNLRKRKDGRFEIIAGERRWRAAQIAGLQRIPALVKEVSDQTALELALIENIQRQDLNPIEEAEAYQYLMSEHHLTQQQLAEQVGKERATVANVLRLLNLDPEIRSWVAAGSVTLAQAKVLLSVQDPKTQRRLAQQTKDQKLTVRALEKLVKNLIHPTDAHELEGSPLSPDQALAVMALQEKAQKALGSRVDLQYNEKGAGRLTLHFHTQGQLESWLAKLGVI